MGTAAVRGAALLVACALMAGCRHDSGNSEKLALVGTIVEVLNQQAMVDGRRAAGGDQIPAGARVVTDGTGAARFRLREDRTDCELRPSSEIAVLPTSQLLLRLVHGSVVCDRQGARSPARIATPVSEIEVGNSTIVVERLAKGPSGAPEPPLDQVSLVSGDCVKVAPEGGTTGPLCPGQKAPVFKGERLKPTAIKLEETDPSTREAIERIRPGVIRTTTTTSSTTTSRPPRTTTSTSMRRRVG